MMGCGASSSTQISPVGTDSALHNNHKSETNSVTVKNSTRLLSLKSLNTSLQQHSRNQNGNIRFSYFFPCRFVNSSTSIDESSFIQAQSVEVQTDDDLVEFQTQDTQTDSSILSPEEFRAMVEALEREIESGKNSTKNSYTSTHNFDDPDEEIVVNRTVWRNLNDEMADIVQKQFVNVAVQATKKKSTSFTQTRFGSVDHLFVPKKDCLMNPNDLDSLSQNLCKMILNQTNAVDQNLGLLLSSMDEDDDEMPMGKKTVNSLRPTSFTRFESDHVDGEKLCGPQPYQRENLWMTKSKQLMKEQRFQECLIVLLEDIRNKKGLNQLIPQSESTVKKRDVSLQTDNDILTDEAPEYAARSPLCHKNEMIPSVMMFKDIDERMQEAPDFETIQDIAQHVGEITKTDLFKIRALFVWITNNIRYSFKSFERDMNSLEILQQREGSSKDYCRLFGDLCRILGIRVKKIDGFVRDYNFRPGYHFQPGKDALNSWNAVFVLSSWRFIDLTLASGYTDASGVFHPHTNEHYFLTDPSKMIWTHFPYSDIEKDYQRWQLLDKPLTLDEFNALPKATEYFFQYNLSVRSKIESPLAFRISTEIKIGSHEAMRYKYKLFPADETENSSLNRYVFCQLKEDRLVGSFLVQPPLAGRFILKIYAKPEREMHGSQQDLTVALNPIVTMLLDCTKARKYMEPFPLNDLPWGLTQKFYDYKLRFCNQKGPIIVTWGGRRRLVLEANETMLLTYSLCDSDSMEMDTRNIVIREDNGFKTIFTFNPPRVGTFKFMLFGMPKPKQKGKWRLPLLATLMIDCKLIKPPQHDEDMVATSHNPDEKNDKKGKDKK